MSVIEIRNEGKKPIWAMACRTGTGAFIHIGTKRKQFHSGKAKKVQPEDYAILEIVEF